MKRRTLIPPIALALIALIGCAPQSGATPEIDYPTLLPRFVVVENLCFDPADEPEDHTRPETFEDWVSGAEAVVVGTVAEIRPVLVPFRQVQAIPMEVSWDEAECSADVLPALDVRLVNVETLYGEPRDAVVFRAGRHLINEWESRVASADTGEYWIESQDNPEHGVAPGMRIGLRLYTSQLMPDVLSPAMTWLFEFDEEDRIRFQRHERYYACAGEVGYFMRPEDAVHDGLDLDALRAGLEPVQDEWRAGVRVAPEESTRPYVRSVWRATPGRHEILIGAGYCDDYVSSRVGCTDDSDCGIEGVCVDQDCVNR